MADSMIGKILHAVVARRTVVLAEYNGKPGNLSAATQKVLERIPPGDMKMTYQSEAYYFHFISEDGIIFCCAAEATCPRRVTFAFLTELKEIFEKKYDRNAVQLAPLYGLADFTKEMASLAELYNQNNVDRFKRVQDEVDSVKDLMVQNVGKVLERGEKIEVLVDRADALNEQAFQFKKRATSLKRKMWWKNKKMVALMVVVVALVVYFLMAMFCGGVTLPCLSG